jgi:hypothetical protein
MSDEQSGENRHAHAPSHEPADAPQPVLRFEAYADAPSAQAAFEAMYPAGSPLEPAVQALVDLGAHCKALGPGRVACRYLENEHTLAGWCWHVALDAGAGKTIDRTRIRLTAIGP